jgi:hypothetical protein
VSVRELFSLAPAEMSNVSLRNREFLQRDKSNPLSEVVAAAAGQEVIEPAVIWKDRYDNSSVVWHRDVTEVSQIEWSSEKDPSRDRHEDLGSQERRGVRQVRDPDHEGDEACDSGNREAPSWRGYLCRYGGTPISYGTATV